MAKTVADLASAKCKPCEGGVAPLKETRHPFAGAARINLTLRRAG